MLLTRAPLRPKPSFDLHVLGMPPAFVLSQNQTLKFMSDKPARGKTRTGRPASLGAVPAQIHITVDMYEDIRIPVEQARRGPVKERLVLPFDETQRSSPTGAAAHMSLHLKPTMSKSRRVSFPLIRGNRATDR